MANIKSAEKRIAVNQKKNLQNRSAKSRMQTAIKKFYAAINNNDAELAEKLLPETMSIVDSTASSGAIHKNNASAKIASISKALSDLKSGKIVIVKEEKHYKKAEEKAALAKAKAEKDAQPKKAVKEDKKVKAEKEEKPAKKAKKEEALDEPKKAAKAKAKKAE